ncbi:MAG: metalloregulator ArsR/SmtB family transcription factor [Pseudomonadota bacterium]
MSVLGDGAASIDAFLAAMRALAEPTRLRIAALCAATELTVTELTQILGQSQPRVSRHLKVLVEAGALRRRTEAGWAFYGLDAAASGGAVARGVLALAPTDASDLAADRARLDTIQAERAARAQAYFEANAPRWDEIRALHVDEAEVERAVLAAAPAGPIGRFIDIGAGTGRLLSLLAPRTVEAIGVDVSHAMLEVARTQLAANGVANATLRLADMYRLPLDDGACDLAAIHQVLHFADKPAAAIAEAARVLKPGGRLIVVDFAPHDEERLRDEHAHRRLGFAPDAVAGWCAAAGLDPQPAVALPGGTLTVLVWAADRPAETLRKSA